MKETNIKFAGQRLVIVSNRLPVVITRDEAGNPQVKPGSGGLVTAIAPVLRNRGGLWIGWPGTSAEEGLEVSAILDKATSEEGYSFKPIILTANEKEKYYYGFSNEILWPLFHDFQPRSLLDPSTWTAYREVNQKFARLIAENTKEDDYIWIHDYHLMLVAQELRALGVRNRIGFFLHIPFPQLDFFLKLPWRFDILTALLENDLIGFQTLRDRRNFVQCTKALRDDVYIKGKGQVITCHAAEREVRIGNFPISIDYKAFAREAASKGVAEQAWYIHEDLPNRQLILGIDRLDYTKGILNRLEAFRNALERFPELRGKVTLVQVVVPSREEIEEYRGLKKDIDRLVGEINGQLTQSGWVPIHYLYRSLDFRELLGYYRSSEIALITPLKDGMNLVAKEFCACSVEENCVLILSEFAGAASQLQRGAILVNPYDVEEVSNAIYKATQMGEDERRSRMKRLRRSVRQADIFWWVDSFLRAGFARNLDDFPLLEDYLPRHHHRERFEA